VIRSRLQGKHQGISNGNGMIVQSTMGACYCSSRRLSAVGICIVRRWGRLRCGFVVLKGRRKESNSGREGVFYSQRSSRVFC
jgi:hypothetical protein